MPRYDDTLLSKAVKPTQNEVVSMTDIILHHYEILSLFGESSDWSWSAASA
jgi:hypothetical protein